MRIAVYGASGYTGKLVAAELARRGIDTVLVGRDAQRLRQAAEQVGVVDAEIRVADLADPTTLADAFRGCDAVISCVAPFTTWGEPVVAAAIAAGCHYVDTTGEQMFVKHVFDAFAQEAEHAGVTAVPAATDDGLLGDLVAHLTAERVEPVEEITIAHRTVADGASRGTLRSASQTIDVFRRDGLTFHNGQWHTDLPAQRSTMVFPGTAQEVTVSKSGLVEVVTVPRHVPVRRVEGLAEVELIELFAAIDPKEISNLPEGPDEVSRRAARFTIVVDALGTDGRRAQGVVQGPDMYGTTAITVVEAARRLVTDDAKPGVLAPAQAYDPTDFLTFVTPHGVQWTIQ